MTDKPLVPDETVTTEILLDALKRAADAHGVYEAGELGGVHDANWPQWYAEHMTRTLAAAGYRLSRVTPPET